MPDIAVFFEEFNDGFSPRATKTLPSIVSLGRFIGHNIMVDMPDDHAFIGQFSRKMAEALLSDLWFMLYDPNAEVSWQNQRFDAVFSRGVLNWLLKQDQIKQIIQVTNNLPLTSASAAVALFESLIQDREFMRMSREHASSGRRDARNQSDQNQDSDKDNDSDQPDKQKGGGKDKNKSRGGRDDSPSEADKSMDEQIKNIDTTLMQGKLSKTMRDVGSQAETFAYAMKTWGIEQSDKPNNIRLRDIQNTIGRNQAFLETMSVLIGRFLGIGNTTLEQVVNSQTGTIAEAALTRDLTMAFPLERLMLTSPLVPPAARSLAISRYAAHGVLGWQKKSDAHRMGSFVGLVDGSGSMNGMPVMIAKSLALGIARVVMTGDVGDRNEQSNQNRRWALCEFGSYSEQYWLTDEREKGEMIRWAIHQFGGGTIIESAVYEMIKKINGMIAQGVNGIDALIITDSDTMFSDVKLIKALRELKDKHGLRIFYIQIGQGKLLNNLEKLSDVVLMVDIGDIKGLEQAAEKITVEIVKSLVKGAEDSILAIT